MKNKLHKFNVLKYGFTEPNVTEVNTNQDYDEKYTVVHVFDDLPYRNHTVSIKWKRE